MRNLIVSKFVIFTTVLFITAGMTVVKALNSKEEPQSVEAPIVQPTPETNRWHEIEEALGKPMAFHVDPSKLKSV